MSAGLTLTGADERTPLNELCRLANAGAEIGILYTFDPESRPRYPSAAWILHAARALKGRAALHVCGSRARSQLLAGKLAPLLAHVSRVQVNGRVGLDHFGALCEGLPCHTLITQHNKQNAVLASDAERNHALLVDGSGGRGLLPDAWQRPATEKPVGFAGGLTPDNLAEQLPRIAAVAQGCWWVDMESSLRDADDWFSVEKAWQAVAAWKLWRGQGAWEGSTNG